MSAALLFTGVSAANAAAPVAEFASYYDSASLSAPVAGTVTHIVGTDLDQVTGAKYVGVSPAFGAVTATVSEQTSTSLSVSVPTIVGQGTSELFLTTSAGDVLVGYFQHVGATKIASSISLRSQVPMAATARVGDAARDLSSYAMVNVTNMAAGTFPVTFTTNNSAICAVVAKTLTFTGAGNCTLSAQLLESNGIAASNIVTKDIVVAAAGAAQTITAPRPNTMLTILGGSFSLNATASSGLPVTYTGSTNSVCRVIFDTVIAISLGTCIVTVTQAGNATFSAATPYVYNIPITAQGVPGPKSAPKFPSIGTKVKVKATLPINLHPTKGTTTAGANVDGLITKISVASASKSICSATVYKSKAKKVVAVFVKGLKVGKCTLSVAVSGNAMYNSQTKTFTVTVTK